MCGHCSSGPGAGRDLHPGGVWMKCGEKGCRSSNFNFHARCHGISIVKEQAKSFCEKFIRCPVHVNQGHLNLGHLAKDLASSDEDVSDSDIDFQPNKQPRKRKKQEKLKQTRQVQVSTPGSYNLLQSAIDSSDADTVECQEINSIEKLDKVEVIETVDKIFINYDDENTAKAEDVASKLKSGQAKVGLVDGEQIIFNVSPVTKARLVKDAGETFANAVKPSGSNSFKDKPLKLKNTVKAVKKFTAPINTVKKGEQIERPEIQKVFKQKPVHQKVTKPQIKLASYLEDLDNIYY